MQGTDVALAKSAPVELVKAHAGRRRGYRFLRVELDAGRGAGRLGGRPAHEA
jgi:hypothetical protein